MWRRLSATALVACATFADAQTPDMQTKRRATKPAYELQLRSIETALADVMLHVESVPPKEAEFIDREIRASMETNSSARFNAAYSNQYYHAFRTHDAHAAVAKSLGQARQMTSIQQRTEHLVDALSRFSELHSQIAEYMNTSRYDQLRRASGQSKLTGQMSFDLTRARGLLTLLIGCNVRLLKEP